MDRLVSPILIQQIAWDRGPALAEVGFRDPSSLSQLMQLSNHPFGMTSAGTYPLVEQSLKPGGIILLEAYSKSQLSRDTGGPKDADMLISAVDTQMEFPNCEVILCHEIEREVVEGEFHTGMACVVQFIEKKRS